MLQAVQQGRLRIPISQPLPLAKGMAALEAGTAGKVILIP